MNMREARCRAEASSEDLTRTMTLRGDDIKRLIQSKMKINGHEH